MVALACGCGQDGAQIVLDTGSAPTDAAADAGTDVAQGGDAGDGASVDGDALDAAEPDATAPDVDAALAGDVEADAADAPQPGITIDAWCGAWSAAWCELLARCPLPGAAGAGCIEAAAAECFGGAGLAEAVAAGALAFDADAAQACLDGLGDLSCEALQVSLTITLGAPVASCGEALTPQQAPGEPCALGTECAGGTCVFAGSCPGSCEALGDPGDPCGPDAFCDFARAACLEDACVALPDHVGDPCPDLPCAAPLSCVSGACAAASLGGEPCGGGNAPCYPGLVCVQQTVAAAGTCAAPRTVGEPCFASDDCAAGEGGPLLCVGGSCQPAPSPGQPCFDFACDAAGTCDLAAIPPTCVPRPGAGEPCANGSSCAAGLFCSQGKCAALLPVGAACESPHQCASGRCPASTCIAPDAPACAATY
jgi:hypothetical protein